MVRASLDILPVHRDVVLEVRVGEEDVCPSVLHLLEKTRKVGRTQLKFFAEGNAEVARVLLNPLIDALAVIDAVICVLKCESQLQALLEFSMIHKTAEKLRCRIAQEVGGAQSPENILIATAEDGRSGRTGRNPWGLVSVWHHGLGLAESGGVATEHSNDIIGAHGALHQPGGLRLI